MQKAGGPKAWLDQQLNPSPTPDTVCDRALQRFPLRAAHPPHLWATQPHFSWHAMDDVVRATFTRAVWSKRQLFEVMVELWSNHLNITTPSTDVWATKPWDDAHVIRKHALGRFEDMLVASGTSPAMMLYLDNASSKGTPTNGSGGVDHGHGNAVLLMGGGILGGKVHGTWPGLTPDKLDHGDLAGSTDYRDILAEVLSRRAGVSATGVAQAFPGHKTTPLGITRPLG